jgi:hypothetical protein
MASEIRVNSITNRSGLGTVTFSDTGVVLSGVSTFTVSSGSVSSPSISPTGDSNTGIFFPAADTIAFAEGGVEAARLDSSGRLGIGTTNPSQKLDVIGVVQAGNGTIRGQMSYSTRVEMGAASNHNLGFITNNTTQMLLDTSGNFQFNSGYGSAATAYGCRAWVNFNGTTASPSTIRGSGNISSVTKFATGQYGLNFTTAMPDANYSTVAQCIACGIVAGLYVEVIGSSGCGAPTTSSTALRVITPSATTYDSSYVYAAVFR